MRWQMDCVPYLRAWHTAWILRREMHRLRKNSLRSSPVFWNASQGSQDSPSRDRHTFSLARAPWDIIKSEEQQTFMAWKELGSTNGRRAGTRGSGLHVRKASGARWQPEK